MVKQAAKKEEKAGVPAVQKSGVPAAYDYGDDANSGFQNHTNEDYTIPFYTILQKISPRLDTIKDAEAGQIINTATGELFTALVFVPVLTQHVFVEWAPRKESSGGSGFVGIHQLDSDVVKKAKATFKLGEYKNGKNDLIETYYVYGLAINGDQVERGVMPFYSTKIKKYKGWMTRARSIQIKLADGRRINPPLFAHKYKIEVVKEKNNEGDFFNYQIGFAADSAEGCRLAPTDPLYEEAKGVQAMVESGAAKMDHSAAAAGGDANQAGKGGKAPF